MLLPHRGIDEIPELRERVKYAPLQSRFKVYIIDEVHMLTTEAFNALLKNPGRAAGTCSIYIGHY